MQTSKQTFWQDHGTHHLCCNSPCASHACSEKMYCPSASLLGCKSSLQLVSVNKWSMMPCSVYSGTHHLSSDHSSCVLHDAAHSVHIQHWLAAALLTNHYHAYSYCIAPYLQFSSLHLRRIPGFPKIDTDNDYFLARFDGALIDGQSWTRVRADAGSMQSGSRPENALHRALLAQLQQKEVHRLLVAYSKQCFVCSAFCAWYRKSRGDNNT